MSKEIDPHISELYEIKKILGSGAYGHVWRVTERESSKQFALKKIFDAFHNDIDAQRTYRQISILHELDHYNIIKLHKVIKQKNNRDLYLVFDFMEADLQSLIGQQVLQDVHVRFVIFQILKALKYLHSAQLIHRDLKPSNILINSECEIKVCDFGLVRSLVHQEDEPIILTEQVATRWYRSPEMVLGSNKYGKETDVWSAGCVIGELLLGEPMFPGDSTLDQLQKILEFTGKPSKQSISSIQSEHAENLINQVKVVKKSFDILKKANPDIVSLLYKMLQFNPKKRITIDEALQLEMFDEFKLQKSNQDICTKFIVPYLDESIRLSVQEYRKMIYCDIERRYPELNSKMIFAENSSEKQVKENKRVTRSYHSFSRQKSSDNIRQYGHFSIHSKHSKKQSSMSFHDTSDKIIKRMKKDQKKSSHQSTATHSHCPSQIQIQIQPKLEKSSKIPFYNRSNSKADLCRNSTNALTKVRSRKVLYKAKSKNKLQCSNPQTGNYEKKKLIR